MPRRAHSILKALTWRATATVDTFVISYIVTGKLRMAGAIVSVEVVTKLVIYYLHERAWARAGLWRQSRKARKPPSDQPPTITL